ncbi:MAG: hypothetical protein LH650_05605 [Chloroflexi bacterium]|nr:hypothetical protein [Chloroflexota bacterium]
MAEIGATRARDPTAAARSAVRQNRRFLELRDSRWLDRLAALDGARLRHRVTRHERKWSALRVDPDLTALSTALDMDALHCAEGITEISLGWTRDHACLPDRVVPERYLRIPYELARRLRPGATVEVVVTGDTFRIELDCGMRDRPVLVDRTLEAVAASLLQSAGQSTATAPVDLETLLFETLARDPSLLRGSREAVGEMLRRCDLATKWGMVASPLIDWDEYAHWSQAWDLVRRDQWRHERMADDWQPGYPVATGWYDIGSGAID